MKKKKGLGRGLSALFGDEKSENKPKTKNIGTEIIRVIKDSINAIVNINSN